MNVLPRELAAAGYADSKIETSVIPALTGARLFAAMMILFHHVAIRVTTSVSIHVAADTLAMIAMPLFFSLSGFVMWINYAPQFRSRPLGEAAWAFASARFARLFPMYIAVLFVGCAMFNWPRVHDALPALAFWVLLVQTWLPAYGSEVLALVIPPIGHLWSVSVEASLYLFFPILVLVGSQLSTLARLGVFCGCSLMGLAFIFVLSKPLAFGLCSLFWPMLPIDDMRRWITYYSPLIPLVNFALGCAAAIAVRSADARARPLERGALLALALAALGTSMARELVHYGIATPPSFLRGTTVNALYPSRFIRDIQGN